MNRFKFSCLLAVCWAVSLVSVPVMADALAITHVNVVDVASGTLKQDQTVVIDDGVITQVSASSQSLPASVTGVVNGVGKYLSPGLMDMHTHTMTPDQLIVNMAHGVTTIRVMWGNPQTLVLREALEENRIAGPRIVTAGMLLDGEPPYWPGSVALTDPELADEMVAQQKADGYDFVKVYSRLTPEAFDAIADAANEHGIEFSGHVPQAVPMQHAIDAGMRTSEHFIGAMAAVLADENLPNPDVSPMFDSSAELMKRIGRGELDPDALIDWDKVPGVANYVASQEHWLVPTHDIMRNFTDDPMQPFPTAMRYLTPEERAIFEGDISEFFGFTEDQLAGESAMYPHRTRLLRAFYDAGAKILVGTDHQTLVGVATIAEMQALEKAGMSRIDVIRAATIEPANYLGRSGELGEVKVGAEADLLLLKRNPLEDLSAFNDIEGVMARGTWYDRKTLGTLLDGVATRAASGP